MSRCLGGVCSFALRALLVVALLVLARPAADAQVLYGSLTGNVTDPSGAAVPGATVTATNKATGVARQGSTDARGVFLFNDLQPGTYDFRITTPSFATTVQEGVAVDANAVRRMDVTLQVAQVSESVVVSGGAVLLQTDRADVSNQLAQTQITDLPVGGARNFQNLYKLIPGFSPPAEAHSDAGNPQRALVSNVNGIAHANNNTRLDGAMISYPWLPHIVAYVPPADAVETVNIVTNAFDAEQGMAGGAAVNVAIKSGTNQFHGSVHEFHTNSRLRARNYFYYGEQLPKNILNQFGGTIGGPIVRNKLFFFGDWERTVRRQNASNLRTVPDALTRVGDFSATGVTLFDPTTGNPDGTGRQMFPGNRIPDSQIDPAARRLLSLVPAPNRGTVGFANNYFASNTYEFNRDNADIKVNYNPTSRASLFARYSLSLSDIFDPPVFGVIGDAINGGQPGSAPGRVQSAAVGGTYTLTPAVVIDANVGFTRQRLSAENIDLDRNYGLEELNIPGTNGSDRLQAGYPRFTISGYSSLGNANVSNPFLFRDQQWVTTANTSWIRGAHSFRFGGEYAYFTINHFQPQTAYGPRGGFNFTGGLTALSGGAPPNQFNALADFLLGLPRDLGKDLQYVNPAAVRMPSYAFYLRDQWQVNRRLTLNYGVRFERYPAATRDHRGVERYDVETDKVYVGGLGGVPEDTGMDTGWGMFVPRIGIAYRATDRTVIRAGYGTSVDPNTFRYWRDAYPAVISLQLSGNNQFQAAGSLRTGIPAVTGPDLTQGVIDLPRNVGTTTFPRDFRRGYIHSYNATIQQELGAGFTGQVAYVGSRAIRQMAIVNLNAAGPGGGNPGRTLFARTGRIADIRQVTPFNTAFYDSLQVQVNRRLVPDAQIGLAYTWSKSINYADNNDSTLTRSYAPEWGFNRAAAGFDRTHNLQVFGIYELPFGRGRRWATTGPVAWLAGGWQLNGILSALTGAPFTVTASGASVNAPGNTQTADQVKADVRVNGLIGPGERWFDPTAFAPVTAVRFGTSGRNTLRGPGQINLDASLFRNFRLTERFNMQFRAEAFNVSNTPAFNNPGADISRATFNTDGSIRATNGFSEITGAAATERQFRFALKVLF